MPFGAQPSPSTIPSRTATRRRTIRTSTSTSTSSPCSSAAGAAPQKVQEGLRDKVMDPLKEDLEKMEKLVDAYQWAGVRTRGASTQGGSGRSAGRAPLCPASCVRAWVASTRRHQHQQSDRDPGKHACFLRSSVVTAVAQSCPCGPEWFLLPWSPLLIKLTAIREFVLIGTE